MVIVFYNPFQPHKNTSQRKNLKSMKWHEKTVFIFSSWMLRASQYDYQLGHWSQKVTHSHTTYLLGLGKLHSLSKLPFTYRNSVIENCTTGLLFKLNEIIFMKIKHSTIVIAILISKLSLLLHFLSSTVTTATHHLLNVTSDKTVN